MNLFVTSLLMTFINILIVAIWKSRQAFRAYGRGNMPLQAVKLPISHNNVVGEKRRTINLRLPMFGWSWTIGGESMARYIVSLEMNSEPLVWEHQSPKCFGGEPTILMCTAFSRCCAMVVGSLTISSYDGRACDCPNCVANPSFPVWPQN